MLVVGEEAIGPANNRAVHEFVVIGLRLNQVPAVVTMHLQYRWIALTRPAYITRNVLSHLPPDDLLVFKGDVCAHQQSKQTLANTPANPVPRRTIRNRYEENVGVDDSL